MGTSGRACLRCVALEARAVAKRGAQRARLDVAAQVETETKIVNNLAYGGFSCGFSTALNRGHPAPPCIERAPEGRRLLDPDGGAAVRPFHRSVLGAGGGELARGVKAPHQHELTGLARGSLLRDRAHNYLRVNAQCTSYRRADRCVGQTTSVSAQVL